MKINYSDSEVGVFHPICEKALNLALEELHLSSEYQVLHHQSTGSLEMDFVIKNRSTGKYLCVIEVKKTKNAVNSERYQYQAMSYVQSAIEQMEKNYYILTNLEYITCFRYDKERPRYYQQRLENGSRNVDEFKNIVTDKDLNEFTCKLKDAFKKFIEKFIHDSFTYDHSFQEFIEHIKLYKAGDLSIWKSYLAVCFYQYIRGSQIQKRVSRKLKDIKNFRGNIEKLCDEALMLNFKSIFDYHSNPFTKDNIVDRSIISEMFKLGQKYPIGDKIADLLHYYVSYGKEIDGEVATDTELSKVVAMLAHLIHGNLKIDEYICDPAAGSGNLIHATAQEFKISPNRILANDINSKLLEILSLRLGLEYIDTIKPNNSPSISDHNIETLPKEYFNNVGVLVINPPYVSGINCIDRKEYFFNRIKELTGKEPITQIGQMPLEGAFLELITHLLPQGTTVACVLSKSHLLARGVESTTIRKLILNSFGLRIVFDYPRESIFEHVIKDTFVFIGKLGQPAQRIDLINCIADIPDVDIFELKNFLKENLGAECKYEGDGFAIAGVSYDVFSQAINDGWRFINPTHLRIKDFLTQYFYQNSQLQSLDKTQFNLHRGEVANKGGSDLIYLNKKWFNSKLKDKYSAHLKLGMRNADPMIMVLSEGDTNFLCSDALSDMELDEIITVYLNYESEKDSSKVKQKKKSKSLEQLRSIVKNENSRKTLTNSILIPRDIRRYGKAYLATQEIFVSTNFMILNLEDYTNAYLLTTWFTTIFYQLICENTTKNQEGTRKMEKQDLVTTVIPNLEIIPLDLKNELLGIQNVTFLDLENPQVRDIDILWSKILFGNDYEYVLSKAKEYLSQMVELRKTR